MYMLNRKLKLKDKYYMKTTKTLSMVLTFSMLLIQGCNSSSQPDILEFISQSKTPIITGIHETNEELPDGTEKVYGAPSYSISEYGINIVPNPHLGYSRYATSYLTPLVRIIYPPDEAKIVIVKGLWIGEKEKNALNTSGAITATSNLRIVRIIDKSSNHDYVSWDLKDEDGNFVPSGFYRIYIQSEFFDNDILWIDLYLILPFDVEKWMDPTGWLSPDWKNWNIPIPPKND